MGLVVAGIGAFGSVGVAQAATPAMSGAVLSPANPPHPGPPPPRKFRAKFKSREDCERRGGHDFPGHRDRWECRQGPDRNNPWEIWNN